MNELQDEVRTKWQDWPLLPETSLKLVNVWALKASGLIRLEYKVRFANTWMAHTSYIGGPTQ